MLKTAVWALVGLAFLIGVYCILSIERTPNDEPPDRLSNVPNSAKWAGTSYEGYWIDYVEGGKDKVRFRI